MLYYGQEHQCLDSYFQMKEMTAPGTPQANELRFYAKDNGSGASSFCIKNDAGNEVCIPTSGTIPTGTGAAGRLTVWLTASTVTGYSGLFWETSASQLLIGIESGSHLGSDAGLCVDENASSSIIGTAAHSATASHSGALNLLRSQGTHASQTIVLADDRISRIVSQGYDGSAYRDAAAIDAFVDGTPGASDMPARLVFSTTPDGSITLAERMRITQAGYVGIGSTSPNFAGFTNALTIQSGTNVAVEYASTRADADDVLIGATEANYRTNSATHNRIAGIHMSTSGSTANQRGGAIKLFTKADASTTLTERFRIGPLGQFGIGGATYGTALHALLSGGASAAPAWTALDHGAHIGGLTDDDHTQYALLAGRSGGQILTGGTASGDDLTLRSTSNATKGDIFMADAGGNVIIGGGATASRLRILEASGSGTNYTEFVAQAQAADITYTLPADNGDANEVLTTDGSGSLSWTTVGAAPLSPGGRLTLTSATPVLTATVNASTSIYYALYLHDKVPLYDGTNWTYTTFTELTNTTTDNTKNPAAVANNSNYDLFVWSDSGTIRLGRGPAWTSDTGRGTGAGTTELERVNGIWMNKISITNGPAAQRGTYVGTVRSNGTATIDFQFGSTAAGGGAGILGVWNLYNRRLVCTTVKDSTDSWTYTTPGGGPAWRALDNSSTNRVSYVCGLAEDYIKAFIDVLALQSVSTGGNPWTGIGYDSTTALSSTSVANINSGAQGKTGGFFATTSLGYHYMSGIEYPNGTPSVTVNTFYGDLGLPSFIQSGFYVEGWF